MSATIEKRPEKTLTIAAESLRFAEIAKGVGIKSEP